MDCGGGPWALANGQATLELCRDRRVSYLVDTQAWRYHEPRTFRVDKFAAAEYAPAGPLDASDAGSLHSFVEADLAAQASLGAYAYLLPGVVPANVKDDVHSRTLALVDAAQAVLPEPARPCLAFVGAHTSRIEAAYRLVDELPMWITGVYVQLTPVNPLCDSPAKIIDCLSLMRRLIDRGFAVIGGRLAGLGVLARALGVHGTDAGLGEGESFAYYAKVRNHEPRPDDRTTRQPLGGRLYVPQLGRSLSKAEWDRLMRVPALRGLLVCRLPCCAFGQPVESTPDRGREHSLHTRVAEAKTAAGGSHTAIGDVVRLLEHRLSTARAVAEGLRAAGLDAISTEFVENHLAAARFFRDAISDVA